MEKRKVPVVLMHMSGVYQKQHFYQEREIFEMDCKTMPGTNCYCDEPAKEQLRNRISEYLRFCSDGCCGTERIERLERGIHFLDSGNYHYLSLLWIEQVRQPFSLVVFDHHPDMQLPAFGQITSCGGWVREALETNQYLEKVYLAGVKESLWQDVKRQLMTEGEMGRRMLERIVTGTEQLTDNEWAGGKAGKKKLYLSLDKDVLSMRFARCDWDQGQMNLQEMMETVDNICKKHSLIGVDICGERPKSGDEQDLLINDRTNGQLLLAAERWLQDSL